MLTVERLHEVLDYDPATGIFTRRVTTGRHGCWRAGSVAGSPTSKGYRTVSVDGKSYFEHRLAWFYVHGVWPEHQIDHRFRIKADNRISLLRPATNAQNHQNETCARAHNKCGFLGVSRHGKHSYRARITVDGCTYRSIPFATPAEAHAEYLRLKAQHHPFAELSSC